GISGNGAADVVWTDTVNRRMKEACFFSGPQTPRRITLLGTVLWTSSYRGTSARSRPHMVAGGVPGHPDDDRHGHGRRALISRTYLQSLGQGTGSWGCV
ncbi:hypothetical protein E4U42_007721, partial [Claviceps africana]